MGSKVDGIVALHAELAARAPRLAGLVLPRDFGFTDMPSLCASSKQRARMSQAVAAQLAASPLESPSIALKFELDLPGRLVRIVAAELVTGQEALSRRCATVFQMADPDALERVAALVPPETDAAAVQEVACMAYSLRVLVNNMPSFRGEVCGYQLPLGPADPVEDIVTTLLGMEPAKKKRRKSSAKT